MKGGSTIAVAGSGAARPETGCKAPRLCFVGPMIGRNPGYVTTQGQRLSDWFSEAGFPVISVSSRLNRYRRLGDIVRTLIAHARAIDVLVLEVYGGSSFVVEDIASLLGRRFGHALVLWLHGGALPGFMARYPRWSRRVLRRGGLVVTPSPYLAREVHGRGLPVRVIPNALDLSEYRFRLRSRLRPRLFWMRTFHPLWNPEMALRVLARVRCEFPEATLVMAGQDKGWLAPTQARAQALGLAGAIRFPGFLDAQAKAREGDAADIYINTNRVDNMPVAVLEAGAMGLPVVSTEVGGMSDVLTQEETGLLVPDNDDGAMAAQIVRLLRNPELGVRLALNARELAKKSSWPAVRPQWESVFQQVMGRAAAR